MTVNKDIKQVVHVLDSSMEKFERMKNLLIAACTTPDGNQVQ